MKTKKTNPLLYALAGLGLIAGLGVLLMQTRSIDVAAHNEFLTDLRQLKQVDAEWNVDVLRSKTGLASNYDQVASPLPVIDSLKTRVQQEGATLWGDRTEAGAQLSALLEDYSRLMDRKIDLIERFKSQNSILRNSTRFLPKAATDLAEAVRDSGADPAVKAEVETVLGAFTGQGKATVIVASNQSMTSWVGYQFAVGPTAGEKKLNIVRGTGPKKYTIEETAANTLADTDRYTLIYDDLADKYLAYKNTDLSTPLVMWPDDAHEIPHGNGYRYPALLFESGLLTTGVQFSGWAIKDN